MKEDINENIIFDNTFSVGPPSQRFNGRPGDVIEGAIKVNNFYSSKSDLKFYVSILPYGVDSETYRDDFVTRNGHNIVTDWVTVTEPTGVISPNNSQDIHFKITIPKDAPGGGQYFIISVGNSEPVNYDAKVKDSVEIASVIYLNVDGEIIREGNILENSVPIFSFKTPVTTTSSFKNNGNTHLDAIIRIEAKDIFTGEQVYPDEDEEQKNILIMPGAKRTVQENITQLNPIGLYEISQTITYNGETSTVSRISIVCPIWLAVAIIAAILTGVFLIIRNIISRRRRRSYFSI